MVWTDSNGQYLGSVWLSDGGTVGGGVHAGIFVFIDLCRRHDGVKKDDKGVQTALLYPKVHVQERS